MKIVYDGVEKLHDPRFFLSHGKLVQNTERPERAARLLEAAIARSWPVVPPKDYGESVILAVHTERYVEFLKTAYSRWVELEGDESELVPNVHPPVGGFTLPKNIIGLAGVFIADAACPIGPNTWKAALAAAHSACEGASLVLGGDRSAYCLCRPPGHHVSQERAGGFCYLNNAAIAAQWLSDHGARVAILDVDVHHGNGTQTIFYGRSDVLYVSIHADPAYAYPFYFGHAHERGSGAGEGFNRNIPLPLGTDDAQYMDALASALREIKAYSPSVLVVSLGLDAAESDPYRFFKITSGGFAQIGACIDSLKLPTVFIQEGGYLSDDLGKNLMAFMKPFN